MKNKFTHLRTVIAINLLLYLSAYLIKTFVIWEIENPLKWVLDIPKYSESNRGLLILSYLSIQLVIILMSAGAGNKKEK